MDSYVIYVKVEVAHHSEFQAKKDRCFAFCFFHVFISFGSICCTRIGSKL
jgi:hypothetical protein